MHDVGHLYNLAHFAERKLIEPPFLVQSVFGVLGGISTHPEDVMRAHANANRGNGGRHGRPVRVGL